MKGAPSSAQPPTQPQLQGVATSTHPADQASTVPMLQTSNALLRGAQSFKALIETRTAAVRAEYEERIRVLIQERDTLLAATRAVDDTARSSSNAELIILRREREVWEQQRALWEAERKKWMEERAAIAYQQDEDAKRRLEAEDQARRLRAELLRLGVDNERLTALASGSRMQTPGLPDGAGPSDGFGMSDLEDHFDLTPYISSPTSSTTLPSLSASSTLSSMSSPPHNPVHMEVRSPPLLPFPFDSGRFSPPSASPGTWLHAQLDPPSPTITARSSDATLSTLSPTPGLSATLSTHSPTPGLSSDNATRSTPLSDDDASLFGSRASSAQAPVVPRKLVIRMPTSGEPMRTPIKPRPSILPGEKMEVVHVPRCEIPDEEDEDEFMITLD